MDILEGVARELYKCYEFLRDNPIEESNTSQLLQEPHLGRFRIRCQEEIQELKDVLDGTHDGTIKEEASQVWYWAVLGALSHELEYEDLDPDKYLECGYKYSTPLVPEIEFVTKNGTVECFHNAMVYVGFTCRIGEIEPVEVLQYDLDQMHQKPYIKD